MTKLSLGLDIFITNWYNANKSIIPEALKDSEKLNIEIKEALQNFWNHSNNVTTKDLCFPSKNLNVKKNPNYKINDTKNGLETFKEFVKTDLLDGITLESTLPASSDLQIELVINFRQRIETRKSLFSVIRSNLIDEYSRNIQEGKPDYRQEKLITVVSILIRFLELYRKSLKIIWWIGPWTKEDRDREIQTNLSILSSSKTSIDSLDQINIVPLQIPKNDPNNSKRGKKYKNVDIMRAYAAYVLAENKSSDEVEDYLEEEIGLTPSTLKSKFKGYIKDFREDRIKKVRVIQKAMEYIEHEKPSLIGKETVKYMIRKEKILRQKPTK